MNVNEIATALVKEGEGMIKAENCAFVPSRDAVAEIISDLQSLMFPGFFKGMTGHTVSEGLALVRVKLGAQIERAYAFVGEDASMSADACDKFLATLPKIKALLLKDIEALYLGDPAAKCREEVLLCYPGFYAISVYRMAHELYLIGVPLLSRMMTEYAHGKTGIDIHAGATIGEYFFIDHGTGIVIGETTVIGDNVKLYQGVTLGAKSFELDENGNPVKDIKRHPNIGNNVVIYANATILGGRTYIGDNCTVGASVWLTRSVEAGRTVYYEPSDSKK